MVRISWTAKKDATKYATKSNQTSVSDRSCLVRHSPLAKHSVRRKAFALENADATTRKGYSSTVNHLNMGCEFTNTPTNVIATARGGRSRPKCGHSSSRCLGRRNSVCRTQNQAKHANMHASLAHTMALRAMATSFVEPHIIATKPNMKLPTAPP